MYGHNYERYVDSSTISRFQQQYWSTKQAVLKKLGKKDDECIVASDSELDSKLEMFLAVQESCANLMRVLELYQDKLIVLAQEENSYGRFLKECGKQDKTRAGKMMIATGKTLSFTAQKRLELRSPLVRLYQEVDTFQVRAISDTLITVDKMEKARTTYRGNLMWMKDISQQLDPDMNRQLEKFRKVQGHVRKTKVKFDKLKIDTLQKVDLLVASRCNMFSQALVAYQNTLLQFWEKTSKTMTTVADSFKGYQHYEFNMLKELTETSKKLAEETNCPTMVLEDEEEDDKDKLIFFESEYHDEDDVDGKNKAKRESRRKSGSLQNLYSSPAKSAAQTNKRRLPESKLASKEKSDDDDVLLDISELSKTKDQREVNGDVKGMTDLLTGALESDDCNNEDMMLLNEILNSSSDGFSSSFPGLLSHPDGSFAQQWTATFGQSVEQSELPSFGFTSMFPPSPNTDYPSTVAPETPSGASDANPDLLLPTSSATPAPPSQNNFLPSQLLQMNANFANSSLVDNAPNSSPAAGGTSQEKTNSPKKPMSASSLSKKMQKERSAWFNLFADLDPLGNPDALGSKSTISEEDRSC